MNYELFSCVCSHVDHQLLVSSFEVDDEYPYEISVMTRLTDSTCFWSRVRTALRYIFGSKMSMAEIILDKQQTKILIASLQAHYKKM